MIEELRSKAASHWRTYLPEKWKELKAAGLLEVALTQAATAAEAEIRAWMDRGARLDEAEEIVLPQLIYLKPTTDGLDAETRAELAQMEVEYRNEMAPAPEN